VVGTPYGDPVLRKRGEPLRLLDGEMGRRTDKGGLSGR